MAGAYDMHKAHLRGGLSRSEKGAAMKTLILILVFIATFALVHALYVLLVLVRGEKRAASRRNRRRVL
jgi:flagellar basal body-associated protein FliL